MFTIPAGSDANTFSNAKFGMKSFSLQITNFPDNESRKFFTATHLSISSP